MADTLSVAKRSERMSRVKGRDTKPELKVRRLVHSLGYRYRLHDKSLPGKPDLVFKGKKKVIFVHGCFWHRHQGCKLARLPKSKLDFWEPKLEGNKTRDEYNLIALREKGWEVLTIWECQVKDSDWVAVRVAEFLENSGSS